MLGSEYSRATSFYTIIIFLLIVVYYSGYRCYYTAYPVGLWAIGFQELFVQQLPDASMTV